MIFCDDAALTRGSIRIEDRFSSTHQLIATATRVAASFRADICDLA